ncbi:extracellular solute-binding protein [Paenibacillus agricola]|uniref:Extracellular solute-binding protein n=1 Tax=Paenibacillus agricola TaxID=2716264 RepID=A0ABX0J2Y2_9BACL|nr:extracellular solute-binding protein [Paenibacillus agricola]NHN29479.1 extracellular solute-binding protein [Paenibacillus agricola]
MKQAQWRNWGRSGSLFVVAASLVVGCSNPAPVQQTAAVDGNSKQLEKIRIFRGPIDPPMPDSSNKYTQFFVKQLNIEPAYETAPWGGGADYAQKLQTMIASGDFPDIIRPMNGVEQTLITQGGALALDDLLPKYAPNLWKYFPKEIWDIVRSTSPDGKIYYIPSLQNTNNRGLIIRTDWLKKVGLNAPETQEQFVEMLRAFRDKDPNGNGKADEIPTSGREQGRWFDHIFAMYGVAMWEGYPEWDMIDGKLQYAGVQPNMKEAIKFARELYKEKLLDNETFLNKQEVWTGKILNDTVGAFYHIVDSTITVGGYEGLRKKNPDADFTMVSVPKVPGYEGFYSLKRFGFVEWVIPKKSEAKAASVLKYLDFYYTPEGIDFNNYGIENDSFVLENGAKKYLPEKDTTENWTQRKTIFSASVSTFDYKSKIAELTVKYPTRYKAMTEMYDRINKTTKVVAGDGMPISVYDGFADIKTHKMYQQYLTNIVIGEWPLERFDEFVKKWNEAGGAEVTKRANEWYQKVNKK